MSKLEYVTQLETLIRDLYLAWEKTEVNNAVLHGYNEIKNPEIYQLYDRIVELGIKVR